LALNSRIDIVNGSAGRDRLENEDSDGREDEEASGGVLAHSSAGIRRVSTFRKMVSVREVEDRGRLEMVSLRAGEQGLPYKRVAVGRDY
jgi:hypothetical protein